MTRNRAADGGLAADLGAKTRLQWLLLVVVALAAWLLSGVVFVLDAADKAQADSIGGWGWAALLLALVTWLATTWVMIGLMDSVLPGTAQAPKTRRPPHAFQHLDDLQGRR